MQLGSESELSDSLTQYLASWYGPHMRELSIMVGLATAQRSPTTYLAISKCAVFLCKALTFRRYSKRSAVSAGSTRLVECVMPLCLWWIVQATPQNAVDAPALFKYKIVGWSGSSAIPRISSLWSYWQSKYKYASLSALYTYSLFFSSRFSTLQLWQRPRLPPPTTLLPKS